MRGAHAILLSTLLAATMALPTVAAHTVEEDHDEGVLFVGHPLSDQAGPSTGPQATDQAPGLGSRQVYSFHVSDPDHWVDVTVRYDPGPLLRPGDCTRLTDLDLTLSGPDGQVRELAGCDEGVLNIYETDLRPGDYTVTVSAEHGATVCLPDVDHNEVDCQLPRVKYTYDLLITDKDR